MWALTHPRWRVAAPLPGVAGPAPPASSSGFRGPGRSPAIWSAAASPSATHELVAQPPPPRRAPAAFTRALMAGVRVCYWLLPWHKLALPCSLRAICSPSSRDDAPHTHISRPCCLACRDGGCLGPCSLSMNLADRCPAPWLCCCYLPDLTGSSGATIKSQLREWPFAGVSRSPYNLVHLKWLGCAQS